MALVRYEYANYHRYRLDGRWVKGVTTLVKNGYPNHALKFWSAKHVAEWVADHPDFTEEVRQLGGRGPAVAFLKELPWQKRDEAAARGTEVHTYAAEVATVDSDVEVPERIAPYVEGYINWMEQFNVVPLLVERPCANRAYNYAGTFDLIAEIAGATWLLDPKTGSGVYDSYGLQLGGYAGCEFFLDEDKTEQPMPHIDALGALHVQPGETLLYPVRDKKQRVADPKQVFEDFLAAADVAVRRDERIATYFTTPVDDLAELT